MIPHLIHYEDTDISYDSMAKRWLLEGTVGLQGKFTCKFTTLGGTPEEATALAEQDLAAINFKVNNVSLEWEDSF